MKQRLIDWLRALLLWLDPPPPPQPKQHVDPIYLRACELVREAGALPGEPSGEYRRWQYCYAKLQKEFPLGKREYKRRFSRAIEDALDVVYPAGKK